jgi:methylphosphotriester-DNA--protein-cysteine methyltransferase
LPDCPGAKQISEQNKIWFASIEEAEKAGYKPAGNCPGLINK